MRRLPFIDTHCHIDFILSRMGRPTKSDRSEPAQRSPIFGLIKTTAAAVVVVARADVVVAATPPVVAVVDVPFFAQKTTWLICLSPVRPPGSEVPERLTSAYTP